MASVIEGGGVQGSSYMNNPDHGASASSTAAEIAQVGKERVKELGGITRDRVYQQVDSRKGEVVQGLHDLASTLEKASEQIPSGIARQALGSGSVWGLTFSIDPQQAFLIVSDGTNQQMWILRRDTLVLTKAALEKLEERLK